MSTLTVNNPGNGLILRHNVLDVTSIILATVVSKAILRCNIPPNILSIGDWSVTKLIMSLLPDDALIVPYSEISGIFQDGIPRAFSFDVLTMLNPAMESDQFELSFLLDQVRPQGLLCIALYEEEHAALHIKKQRSYMDSSFFLKWCEDQSLCVSSVIPIFAPMGKDFFLREALENKAYFKSILHCPELTADQLKTSLDNLEKRNLNLNLSLYIIQI